MNGQLRTLDYGDMAPNQAMQRAWVSACSDLRSAVMTWRSLSEKNLPAFNAVLTRNNLKPIAAPPATLELPTCAAAPGAAGHRTGAAPKAGRGP